MSRTRWNYRYFIRSVVVIMCVVFCVGCQKKSQETDLKTVSVREEEPESTPEDSREDTTEDVGKVKEEDTAKKKDDAVPDTEDRPEKLYVHVCGNVNQPGVYELQQDSRVFEAIDEIAHKDYENVVVVTHGGAIRALLTGIVKADYAKWLTFGRQLENCSISEIMYDKDLGTYHIERLNDYAHFEDEDRLLRKHFGNGFLNPNK